MFERSITVLVVLVVVAYASEPQAKVNIHDNRFYRASVAVGSPRQFIWALIDFQSSVLALDPSVAEQSKTYNSLDGYEFLVVGDSNPMYLPTSIADPSTESRLLHSESLMLLGLGPGSPMWRFYRCVTFAGSFLRFSTHACSCDHVVIDCDVDQGLDPPSLCVATGTIALENKVPAQPVTTTFFGDLAFPPNVYSELRFRSEPFHNTKTYFPGVIINGDLRLGKDVYLLQTDSRRIFRAELSGSNQTAVVSQDVVLDWQISIDRRSKRICAVKAPITLHTSTLNAILTFCFAIALPCWYFVDTSNAEIWHFPLPESGWILPFYVGLMAFGALSAIVFLIRIGERPWPSQTLFIESSIWIGIWLIQISASRGSWDLLGASLVFTVFYVVWWQHVWIMILSIWALDKVLELKCKLGDPRQSTACNDFVAKALRICVNKPLINRLVWVLLVLTGVHTYVLWQWILTPLFSSLANFGFIVGSAMTSLLISVAVYTSLWLAEDHLVLALTPDSATNENV